MPWISLEITGSGHARPCCVFEGVISDEGTPLSVFDHPPDEIWNGSQMRHLRRSMLRGEKVPNCAACYVEEEVEGVSARIRSNHAWANGFVNDGSETFESLQIATGSDGAYSRYPPLFTLYLTNQCNLKCRMCCGEASSRIAVDPVHARWAPTWDGSAGWRRNVAVRNHAPQQAPTESGIHANHIEHVRKLWALPEDTALNAPPAAGGGANESTLGPADFIKRLLDHRPNDLRYISCIGGEPLLLKEIGDVLRCLVDSGASRDVTIGVHTNASTVHSPWLELAAHFRAFEISISIDGFREYFEYIRYPAKWQALIRNMELLRRLPNARVAAEVTLQIYNALNVVELFRFLDSIEMPFGGHALQFPTHLRATLLPPRARAIAAERLHAYANDECKPERRQLVLGLAAQLDNFAETGDADTWRDFMLFTNDLDASRGQSFADTHGELLQLIRESGYAWTSETLHSTPHGRRMHLIAVQH
jgi:MoaA/NifB/PqqE/SkfB family radical SAM enzyme